MFAPLLLLMLFVCSNALTASEPKAPGTNLTSSVPAIAPTGEPDVTGKFLLPGLSNDNVAGHLTTSEGQPVLLLKFTKTGATALKIHLANVHLPEGAEMFAYSLNGDGAISASGGRWTGAGDFWTAPMAGDTAYVEVTWGAEIPGDIPFDVPELMVTDANAAAEAPAQENTEIRKGSLGGRAVTYQVKDGLAMYEGDIVLGSPEELEGPSSKSTSREAVGITGARYRWPNGIIPYSLPSNFPNPARVLEAVDHWNTKLAGVIRFVPRTNERNYVMFMTSSGCAAMVGMLNMGGQPVMLGDACTAGNAIHEMGHAVGLWHEQSRADRNSHVRVLWENVRSDAAYNFNQNISDGDDIGAYDFNSIMHYGLYTFSSNGRPTLETIPAGIPIGQRDGLSAGDIAAVRSMYGASTVVPSTTIPDPTPTVPPPAPYIPPVVTTVNVSFATNPTGQQVKIDGSWVSTPTQVTWTIGTNHTIEVASTAGSSGAALQFAGWSDGGAISHSVVASSSLTALKADYAVSYSVQTSVQPAGTGTVSVSPASATGTYAANTSLTLTAAATPGYCFAGWTGLLTGTPAQTSISINGPKLIQAYFQPGTVSLNGTMSYQPATGGTAYIGVTSNSGCAWQVTSFVSWITVTNGTIGTGSNTVTLTVAPNPTKYARVGFVSIGGKGYTIAQPGS